MTQKHPSRDRNAISSALSKAPETEAAGISEVPSADYYFVILWPSVEKNADERRPKYGCQTPCRCPRVSQGPAGRFHFPEAVPCWCP